MSIGINTNIEVGVDFKELYAEVKNVGFDSVMIAFKTGNTEELITCAKEAGLKIPYVHLSCREANSLWVESVISLNYIKKLKSEIDLCNKHNIPMAVIHPTTGNPNSKPIPPSEVGLKNISTIVEYAISKNVKLAFENVDKNSLKYLKFIFKYFDKNKVGFCYDVGHNYLYYPKKDILKKFKDRLIAVHLHDNDMNFTKFNDYTKDKHMLPFDGALNFEKVCKNLADAQYKNTIMLEVNRVSTSNPNKYKEVLLKDFVKEAKKRVDKIKKLITKNRKSS